MLRAIAEKCGQIDPTVYANDIRELDKIVDAHWTEGQAKPLVIGPDCNPIGGSWVSEFLRNASDVLNVYTYHNCERVALLLTVSNTSICCELRANRAVG